jgi:hypothetical protein
MPVVSIVAALGLVAGTLSLIAIDAAAVVNTCRARNLTQGTPAVQDLQAAIDAAEPGDTIQVKRVCVGNFVIDRDLTLVGEATRSVRKATLDANRSGRPLFVNGPDIDVTLIDLRITGGSLTSTDPLGGGIWDPEGDLTLRRTVVTGNAAVSGAGIAVRSGTLTLYGSSVRGNTSAGLDSTGGIWTGAFESTLILNGTSSVRGNLGCGISNNGFDVILNDTSTVKGNACRIGGGIANDDGVVTLNDASSVTRNTAGTYGGGIWVDGTLIMNDSSSVTRNTAGVGGGGIFDCGVVTGAVDGLNVTDNHLTDGSVNNIGSC